MKRPAVFIDRDGTINEQMGYINHLSRFHILPGVAEAIRLLNEHRFLAVVVSNQSGVAQGYFPHDLVGRVHAYLEESLREKDARLDGVFFCPHHPRGSVAEFTRACDCRKPGTGLVRRACEVLDIDMAGSYMVGDRCLDIEMAHRCGIQGILVETGYGLGEVEHLLPGKSIQPAHIARDLLAAVKWILGREKGIPLDGHE